MTRAYEGIIPNLPESEYHSLPSLSSTGAKRLLESPARFHYEQTHPRADKDEFDLGSAVHSKVLGTGYEIVVIPDAVLDARGGLSTAKAKEFVTDARTRGAIPIKPAVADQVNGMAEAVLAHPIARELFEQDGIAEASVFATDPETGVQLRARFDFLAERCVDLKTTGKRADKATFSRTVFDYGYDVSHAHYLHTLELVTGELRRFLFPVVETEPPYLVAVHSLDLEYAEIGAGKARRARQLFATCTELDDWPGYPSEVNLVIPPMFAVYDFQDNYS
jgi:hypothetical protein